MLCTTHIGSDKSRNIFTMENYEYFSVFELHHKNTSSQLSLYPHHTRTLIFELTLFQACTISLMNIMTWSKLKDTLKFGTYTSNFQIVVNI